MDEGAGARRFGPTQRIHRRKDFVLAYDEGVRRQGRFMTVFSRPNGRTEGRLGVSATRRFGCAVERNAAKRRLREIFRQDVARKVGGFDIVVVPRPGLLAGAFPAVREEFVRLASGQGRGRSTAARVSQ